MAYVSHAGTMKARATETVFRCRNYLLLPLLQEILTV